MKVIFLDIDGVLNSNDYFDRRNQGLINDEYDIDQNLIAKINELINKTGAEIVVSSCWRNVGKEKVNQKLRESGLCKDIIGITPKLYTRGEEIEAYLSQHADIKQYVVIDDDVCYIQTHISDSKIANTDWRYGLTNKVKQRALSILNNLNSINDVIVCKCQLCYINELKRSKKDS